MGWVAVESQEQHACSADCVWSPCLPLWPCPTSCADHCCWSTLITFQSFTCLHPPHVSALQVGAFREFMRITRRCAEPVAFSFSAPLHREQVRADC